MKSFSPFTLHKIFAVAVCALLAGTPRLDAATLVSYLFNDIPGTTNRNLSTTADVGSVPANVSASVLTDNIDGNGTAAAFSASSDAYFARGSIPLSANQAGSFAGNHYLTFTVEAAPGFTLNLNSISFKLGGSTRSGGTSQTFNQALQSSVGGFNNGSANIDTSSFTLAGNQPAANFAATRTVSLSALQFQNITGPLEFRFYFWQSSTNMDDIVRLDEITLDGTLAPVPEPSAILLSLAGLAALFLLRQRVRKTNSPA